MRTVGDRIELRNFFHELFDLLVRQFIARLDTVTAGSTDNGFALQQDIAAGVFQFE